MLPFVKLQGAGNDYIALDGRNKNYDWNQLSLDMSKPAFGVGSVSYTHLTLPTIYSV